MRKSNEQRSVILFGAFDRHNFGDLLFPHSVARMLAPFIHAFESLNIWDLCALIAHSRAYAGSRLHGRIVAMAFARPRINLLHDDASDRPSKQLAFAETWEHADVPRAVQAHCLANGIDAALSVDQQRLDETAKRLVVRYRRDFAI